MLHPTQIIKRHLLTEKCTWEGTARNRYSFRVDMRANKHQIRDAIREIYKVRVVKVSTAIRKGGSYRTRRGVVQAADWKKATVQLHPDDHLDLF